MTKKMVGVGHWRLLLSRDPWGRGKSGWQFSQGVGAIAGLLTVLISLWCVALPALSQPMTLSFVMVAPEVPVIQPFLEEFQRQNPDIRINLVEGPTDSNLIEDLNTTASLLGNSPYDLVYLDVAWVPKFAAAGWLLDLSDRFPAADRSAYLTGDIAGGKYKGKLYRIPWRTDAGMLYYRKDLLTQAGLTPPQTFTDLVQIAQTLQTTAGIPWGYVWQGRQYEGVAAMFVEVLAGYGGFWVNPETREVGLDRPAAIAAVEYLLNTLQQGVSPPGSTTYREEDTRLLFQSGQTVFMRNWPYAWTLMNADDSPVKGKFGIQPMVHAPGQASAACLGGWGWGIARSSRHPEAAWRLIQYLTSEDVQRRYSLQSGYLPTRRSLYQDTQMRAQYPYLPDVLTVLDKAALRPAIAQYAQASDILQRHLSAAFSGRMNPTAAMQAANRETRQLLGQGFRLSQGQRYKQSITLPSRHYW